MVVIIDVIIGTGIPGAIRRASVRAALATEPASPSVRTTPKYEGECLSSCIIAA
jgi:hypothetical protein